MVTLRRPAGDYTATDVVNERAVALTRTGEGVAVAVALPPSSVQVLRLERR